MQGRVRSSGPSLTTTTGATASRRSTWTSSSPSPCSSGPTSSPASWSSTPNSSRCVSPIHPASQDVKLPAVAGRSDAVDSGPEPDHGGLLLCDEDDDARPSPPRPHRLHHHLLDQHGLGPHPVREVPRPFLPPPFLPQPPRSSRHHSGPPVEDNPYLNSLWLIMVTFMSIGYGDVVPNTYCGRAMAITTGVVVGPSSASLASPSFSCVPLRAGACRRG